MLSALERACRSARYVREFPSVSTKHRDLLIIAAAESAESPFCTTTRIPTASLPSPASRRAGSAGGHASMTTIGTSVVAAQGATVLAPRLPSSSTRVMREPPRRVAGVRASRRPVVNDDVHARLCRRRRRDDRGVDPRLNVGRPDRYAALSPRRLARNRPERMARSTVFGLTWQRCATSWV